MDFVFPGFLSGVGAFPSVSHQFSWGGGGGGGGMV